MDDGKCVMCDQEVMRDCQYCCDCYESYIKSGFQDSRD
jgi:hypothetical protein